MLGSKPKNKLQPQAKSDLYPVSYEQFSHFERFVKELKKNKEGKKKTWDRDHKWSPNLKIYTIWSFSENTYWIPPM